MPNVTVGGVGGATVTIPFTSADNYILAQYSAAAAITPLADTDKFVSTSSNATVVASGSGVVSSGADIAFGSNVIAGGSGLIYGVGADNQNVYFSASGIDGTNVLGTLANNSQFFVDAGGDSSNAGTLIRNVGTNTAFITAYSGFLAVEAVGRVAITDDGAALRITALGGAGAVINAGTHTVLTPEVTVAAYQASLTTDVSAEIFLPATGYVSIFGYAGHPNVVDTVNAAGSGTVAVSSVYDVIDQAGAGNLFIHTENAGYTTLKAAAGATESVNYSGTEGLTIDLENNNITLNSGAGHGNLVINADGTDTVNALGATGVQFLNLATGSDLSLAGGAYSVLSAGSAARLNLGANDSVWFTSGSTASFDAGLLGATTIGLSSSGTDSFGAGTYLVDGTPPVVAGNHVVNLTGSAKIYFGTPFRTDGFGNVVESINPDVGNGLTAGNIVVHGGTGSQTLFGGGSAAKWGVVNELDGGTGGNNLLVGALTISGGGAGDTLVAGTYTQSIVASTGNTTLVAGTANSGGVAAANETLVGNAGSDTFIFGTGAATMTGAAGADSFRDINLTTAGTTVAITDFTSGTDKVDLFSLTNAAGSGATANVTGQTQTGGDTLVQLSDGVTVRFAGVTSVSSTDFVTNVGAVQVGKVV